MDTDLERFVYIGLPDSRLYNDASGVTLMLSVSQPGTTGQLSKYHKKDDYYLKEKGDWQGKGAEALGLQGEVLQQDFHTVLDGKHPATGVPLRSKKGKERSGIDLTFSAPKSASILALGDGRIKDLHDQAVKRTLDYIESNTIQAREQIDGHRTAFNTGNALFAKFVHLTSREMDPQLHTHCVLMNLTQTGTGKWKAVHNDLIYIDQVKLGQLYRNEFGNLLQKNGYAIEVRDRKKGFFEIAGVDENLIELFSSRRAQVIAKAEEYKETGQYTDVSEARLLELAALGSRAAKPEEIDKGLLKETWLETIHQAGTSLPEMVSASKMSHGQKEAFARSRQTDAHLLRASGLITGHEAVYRKTELLSETARLSLGKNSLDQIEESFQRQRKEGPIVDLGKRDSFTNGIDYFSTREMMAIENEIIRFVNASKNQYAPAFTPDEVRTFLDEKNQKQDWKLTSGQRKAVETILTSRDQVNIIQGDAGTGKTTYLDLIRGLSGQKNISVLGVGFTGKSAAALKQVGIEAMTISSLLKQQIRFTDPEPDRPSIVNRIADLLKTEKDHSTAFEIEKGSILIIDEASMTGNVQTHELLKLADQGNLKVIIQGDKKQLPSISAGRMHDLLQHRTNVEKVFLKESVRQKKLSNARENIDAFQRDGMNGFLENLNAQKNIIHSTRKDFLINDLTQEFLRARESGSVIVLCDQNDLRDRLNKRLRGALVDDGKISGRGQTFETWSPTSITTKDAIYANSYSEGQAILMHETMKDFKKGRYEIVGVDNKQNLLHLRNAQGKIQSLSTDLHGENISAFDVEQKEFSKGDEIVFLKNDKRLGVENGNIGVIEKMDRLGKLTVALPGKVVTFNMNDTDDALKYNYIDHGYAVTIHKAQGSTVERTLYVHDSRSGIPSANSLYVAMTRSRQSTKIFTQSQELLKKHGGRWIKKTSTLDDYEHRLKESRKSNSMVRPSKGQKGNPSGATRRQENFIEAEI